MYNTGLAAVPNRDAETTVKIRKRSSEVIGYKCDGARKTVSDTSKFLFAYEREQ